MLTRNIKGNDTFLCTSVTALLGELSVMQNIWWCEKSLKFFEKYLGTTSFPLPLQDVDYNAFKE